MTELGETFVVRTGWWRIVLVGAALVLCAALFFVLAGLWIYIADLYDRAATWIVCAALVLLSAALAMLLLLYLYTLAVRVEIGGTRVKLRLPRMRGHLPLPGLIRADLPYDVIAAVQWRREIYTVFGCDRLQFAFSLITRDGDRLPLGFMVADAALQYPFGRVAVAIVERAGCPLLANGEVRINGILRGIIYGAPDWGASC